MLYGPAYDADHHTWYGSVQLCIQALFWKLVFSVCVRLVEYFCEGILQYLCHTSVILCCVIVS
jgi:hypothetical protein